MPSSFFQPRDPLLSQCYRFMFLINRVVYLVFELLDKFSELKILIRRIVSGAEIIKGVRASSIKIESTSSTIAKCISLCTFAPWPNHVIAQIIKPVFVVCAVSDVRGIGLPAAYRPHVFNVQHQALHRSFDFLDFFFFGCIGWIKQKSLVMLNRRHGTTPDNDKSDPSKTPATGLNNR